MNRFYRPSTPRYTSQFVEDQYPMDMIMQSGAMKYGQQQKFVENVAEMQALNANLEPGSRTQRIAPQVKQYWNQALNDYTSKFSKNYDSPEALMELTKLRAGWLNDPNVTLIKRDRSEGEQELQAIKKSTDTYHLDYDPNKDPRTGYLKQFNLNDSYQGYQPLVKYQDVDKVIAERIKDIPIEEISMPAGSEIVDQNGIKRLLDKKTTVKRTNTEQFNVAVNNIASEIKSGSTPMGAYLRTHFRDVNGNIQLPNDKEIVDFVKQKAFPMIHNSYSLDYNYGTISDKMQSKIGMTENGSGEIVLNTEISTKRDDSNLPSRKEIRSVNVDEFFDKPNIYNPRVRILDQRLRQLDPNYKNLNKDEQRRIMKDYVKRSEDTPTSYQFTPFDQDTEKEMTSYFVGPRNENGELMGDGSSSVIRGQTVVDLQTGKVVQDLDEKDSMVVKGKAFRMLGRPTNEEIGSQPLPGLTYFTAGSGSDSKTYGVKIESDAKADKNLWNLYGFQRNDQTGVGDVYAVDYRGGSLIFSDVSDSGTNQDQKNVKAKTREGKYFVPIEDIANGDIILRVFKENPTDTDIFDNSNPIFVNEYRLSDDKYKGSINAFQRDIYTKELNIK